jgi:hypothetical protein
MASKTDRFAALDLPQLEDAIVQADAQLQAVEKEIAPLERKRDRQYAELKQLCELRDQKKIDQMGATPDWEWLLSYSPYPPDSMAKHRQRTQALAAFGLMTHGASRETNQSHITIALTRGDAAGVQACLEGLQQILPVLKPGEDGCKEIHVLTHDAGEHGTFSLRVAPGEASYELVFQRYHALHPETLFTTASLASMLAHIQQHYCACD